MSEARDFWSRRKALVAEEAEAEEAVLDARAIEAEQAEKTDEEILADLGLPDPEELREGDDFSGFMAKAVPDRLRRRALRRLWRTNPVLANVDGLVDYGDDFTDAACVLENLQTAYQVGKGMTSHVEEMARQAELEAEGESEETPEAEEIEEDQILADEVPDESPGEESGEGDLTAVATSTDEDPVPAPRRRMQFSFETSEVTSA